MQDEKGAPRVASSEDMVMHLLGLTEEPYHPKLPKK